MKKRKKTRKPVYKNRLTYGIIAITFILAILLIYSSLHPSNQTPSDHTPPNDQTPPEAAIVDHLSLREPNPDFIETCTEMLKNAGFTVEYHKGREITVDFYKNLLKHGYNFIIFRVHSAIMKIIDKEFVGLFTWEEYSDWKAGTKYPNDVLNERLVKAFFQGEEEIYFGIAPNFVEEYGNFKNTVVIMMGCNGLTYTSMAEAFVKKGAKVYISWDGLVGVLHTDQATTHLLRHLITEGKTIEESVDETMEDVGEDPHYGGVLDYYPHTVENYVVPKTGSYLATNVAQTNIIRVKSWLTRRGPTQLS